MSDFIIATDDPEAWHKENMRQNPSHYPYFIRAFLTPKLVARLQTDYGAKIYFNTLVPFEDGLIKYGVISTDDLIEDLLGWNTMYVAGRLHKPVNILEIDESRLPLDTGLSLNLSSALHTAFLKLPPKCSEEELYLTLAGLSYSGDLRMLVGEDKNKVSNIVTAQIDLFRELYKSRLDNLSDYVRIENGNFEQDISAAARYFHMTKLPKTLQHLLVKYWNKEGREHDIEEVLHSAAKDPYLSSQDLGKGIETIVQRSSTPQALKGILSAGPYKATKYSATKLTKMFKSMRK